MDHDAFLEAARPMEEQVRLALGIISGRIPVEGMGFDTKCKLWGDAVLAKDQYGDAIRQAAEAVLFEYIMVPHFDNLAKRFEKP